MTLDILLDNNAQFVSVDLIGEKNQVILKYVVFSLLECLFISRSFSIEESSSISEIRTFVEDQVV